jgi:hypothetical protein
MLEVKLSPEEAKSGADPAALPALIEAVRGCPNLRLLGLMTMPPWSEDPEAPRGYFRRCANWRSARAERAFDGHVARSGDGHRRGLDLRARGNGAVRQAEEATDEHVTVGFYSPLPPARTGVADYAAALLTELRRHGRVEVAPARCDVALYHLGNNGAARRIYRRAMERPGVVVLHDAVLHHFLLGQLTRPNMWTSSSTTTASGIAGWRGSCGGRARRRRRTSGTFAIPMLKRAAERARAVVVHNPAAARR